MERSSQGLLVGSTLDGVLVIMDGTLVFDGGVVPGVAEVQDVKSSARLKTETIIFFKQKIPLGKTTHH